MSDGEEKDQDTTEEKAKNDKKDTVPKPRALHKTSSIFLRNLAPSITKQEVEAVSESLQSTSTKCFYHLRVQSFYGTLMLFWFIELTAYRCVRDIPDLLEWPSRTLSLRGGSSEEPGWHLRGMSTSKRFAGTWTTSGWLTLYLSTQNIESIKPMNISLVLWAIKIYMLIFKWTVKILSMRYIFSEQRRQFYTIFYLNIFSTAEGLWTWSYIKSWTQTESATCQWNLRSQTSGPCRH